MENRELLKLEDLLEDEKIGFYKNCEVTQIILHIKSTGKYWNYFTHIECNECYTQPKETTWLTTSPNSISPDIQILICKQVISVKDMLKIWNNAEESQHWNYKTDDALLDKIFCSPPKFIPETDPTGNIDLENTLVPLEEMLYGSNYNGNYYICELFSQKEYFNEILDENTIKKIQKEIFKAGLQFDIEKLHDRIGNIICKLPIETFSHKTKALTPERGIKGSFTQKIKSKRHYCLHIFCEDDHVLVWNQVKFFSLTNNSEKFEYEIMPNNYKNTIMVLDCISNVIYYMAVRDYTYESNYFGIIRMPQFGFQCMEKRKLLVNKKEISVELYNIGGVGETYINRDISEIEKRRKNYCDKYSYKHNYFVAFQSGEQTKAYETIIDIINATDLLWDLEEIWLVDPYLSPNDILHTIAYSEKYEIKLKCLTNIRTINSNPCTREIDVKNRFEETKQKYKIQLENAIPEDSDLSLEYRTVYKNYGSSFHDRYLILKYGVNRCRAWSLGISVNSLGKSHHIIQIVNTPSEVFRIIQGIWDEVDNDECLIYKK